MNFTRRDFSKIGLAAWPAAILAEPNSRFGGVQIGINVPYSFRGMPSSADNILRNVLQLGLSSVELRSQPVENYLGGPISAQPPGGGPGRIGATLSPEQEPARNKAAEELRKWRLALPDEKFAVFRRKYEEAGVSIDILKLDDFTGRADSMPDDEIDYFFRMAKGLGAKAISCEPPVSQTKRLGAFAERHRLRIGYHGHLSKDPDQFAFAAAWERAYSYSKFNGINLDIGHYTAAGGDAMAFIRQYHERITHIHLKDRKANDGPNVPWGQGDTPVREVLRLMRDQRYPFVATIEFEYAPPEDSDVLNEIGKCFQFCKAALA
jgi:sugar phosphate isomerase/epimerase